MSAGSSCPLVSDHQVGPVQVDKHPISIKAQRVKSYAILCVNLLLAFAFIQHNYRTLSLHEA